MDCAYCYQEIKVGQPTVSRPNIAHEACENQATARVFGNRCLKCDHPVNDPLALQHAECDSKPFAGYHT